jgi:hypothetical protein
MTFDEWFRATDDRQPEALLRMAWDAGQAAERERCAGLARAVRSTDGDRIARLIEGDPNTRKPT